MMRRTESTGSSSNRTIGPPRPLSVFPQKERAAIRARCGASFCAWRQATNFCAPILLLLLAVLQGCVTVTETENPRPFYQTKVSDAAHPAPPRVVPTSQPVISQSNLNAATDPCAVRMHDLIGPLLEYYVLNRQLPARLEQIKPLADADVQLSFVCPVSGQPYVYETEKLFDPQGRQLILHDATPVHGGLRWAIVDGSKPGQARVMTVLPLTEAQFQSFTAKQ